MNRTTTLLLALAAVAIVVASFLFLIKPRMDEVAELQAQADTIRTEQQKVESEISALQQVRSTSPNIEAELAAAGAVVPSSTDLPSALRQLQVAADESGITLLSVSPGRPTAAGVEELPELSTIALNLSLEGGYYQLVDFLRRIENPVLTARGVLIESVTVTPSEYPTLSVTVGGQMYALLDNPSVPAPDAPTDEPTDGATDGATDSPTDGATDSATAAAPEEDSA